MPYPDLPHNRLVVMMDGSAVDVSQTYGMILVDGYKIPPPEAKTHYIDIPGRSGKLDLTEAFGDVFYNNIEMEFSFVIINAAPPIEVKKQEIISLFNGKKYVFYTTMEGSSKQYTGRFKVTDMQHGLYDVGYVIWFKINIDVDTGSQ